MEKTISQVWNFDIEAVENYAGFVIVACKNKDGTRGSFEGYVSDGKFYLSNGDEIDTNFSSPYAWCVLQLPNVE